MERKIPNIKWLEIENILEENIEKVQNEKVFSIIELFTDFETFKKGMLNSENGPLGIALLMINQNCFTGEEHMKKNEKSEIL